MCYSLPMRGLIKDSRVLDSLLRATNISFASLFLKLHISIFSWVSLVYFLPLTANLPLIIATLCIMVSSVYFVGLETTMSSVEQIFLSICLKITLKRSLVISDELGSNWKSIVRPRNNACLFSICVNEWPVVVNWLKRDKIIVDDSTTDFEDSTPIYCENKSFPFIEASETDLNVFKASKIVFGSQGMITESLLAVSIAFILCVVYTWV